MSNKISVTEFTNFLNATFKKGLSCPLCGSQEWDVREEDGNIDLVQTPEPLNIQEIDTWFSHEVLPDERYEELAHPKAKISSESIAIRCACCGYLAHFDKMFVEEKIHG